MSSQQKDEDDLLLTWDQIKQLNWSGILIGNGASLTIWELFRYKSLYEQSKSTVIAHALLPEEQAIFDSLITTNFEQVLASLSTAETVCKILNLDTTKIHSSYERIKLALGEAVHATHISWKEMPEVTLKKICAALRQYEFVYSTNYDLILYWAIMAEKAVGFKDYFWKLQFNLANTEVWKSNNPTKILYLHGALHLYRFPSGETFKETAEPLMNLLDIFAAPHTPEAVPLIVTEGTSKDKMASISHSDYLTFAYSRFYNHNGPVIVFGHSLGDSDMHLLDAMRNWHNNRIAISIKRGTSKEIIARKVALKKALPDAILMFFDAETHPLGDPALKVPIAQEGTP